MDTLVATSLTEAPVKALQNELPVDEHNLIDETAQTFELVLFKSLNNPVGKRFKVTWPRIKKRFAECHIRPDRDGLLISAACYPEGKIYREGKNVIGFSGLFADFDESHFKHEVIELINFLDAKAILHSTHSHGTPHPKKKGRAPGERYRVFFPLDHPISVDGYPEAWERLNILFGCTIDPACKSLERSYFLPAHPTGEGYVFETFEGRLLCVRDLPPLPENFYSPTYAFPSEDNLDKGRPGDLFNRVADNETTAKILEAHDWEVTRSESQTWMARRPGKVDPGNSATIGHYGPGVLHVFSSNAAPFEEGRSYKAFSVKTLLEFDGSYRAAAQSLWQQGFRSELHHDLQEDVESESNASALRASEESKTEIVAAVPATSPLSRYDVFRFSDMANLPPSQWLIQGLLQAGTTSVLSGDSGSFKTFIALEMALCIATGKEFHRRQVKQGNVVFIAAEGFYTLRERALAWAQMHKEDLPENLLMLNVPVNLSDEGALRKLISTIENHKPVYIVLDTLSQCAQGLNENSNDEMARFIAGMAEVGQRLGCHVQTLHHNAKSTGTFRGAGVIKANVDAHITLERDDDDTTNTVFMRCEKLRGRPFEPFALRGQEVLLPFKDEFGEDITSLVFFLADDVKVGTQSPKRKDGRAEKKEVTEARILKVLEELNSKNDTTSKEDWREEVLRQKICNKSHFYDTVKELDANGKWIWDKGDCQFIPDTPSNRRSEEELEAFAAEFGVSV